MYVYYRIYFTNEYFKLLSPLGETFRGGAGKKERAYLREYSQSTNEVFQNYVNAVI